MPRPFPFFILGKCGSCVLFLIYVSDGDKPGCFSQRLLWMSCAQVTAICTPCSCRFPSVPKDWPLYNGSTPTPVCLSEAPRDEWVAQGASEEQLFAVFVPCADLGVTALLQIETWCHLSKNKDTPWQPTHYRHPAETPARLLCPLQWHTILFGIGACIVDKTVLTLHLCSVFLKLAWTMEQMFVWRHCVVLFKKKK